MNKTYIEGRRELFPLIFIGKQRLIWDALISTGYKTTGELAKLTDMPSKNVSKQLEQMSRTGLVKFTQNGKLKSWTKID